MAKLLLVLFGLMAGCVAAEAGLRIIGYSNPIFFETDAERGYALIPNVEGWFWPENKNYVRINSDGFRDREHTKAKPADTVRIAVLGDSFAEARHVSADSTFWAVMEKRLQGCRAFGGKKVEVLNFGVSGYETVEELLTLRQSVWEYSPDIVLLTVTTYNDITDNYRPFKRADELPYFTFEDGRLTCDYSFRDSAKYRWHDSRTFKAWVISHNHSRVVQLLHHAQFAIRTRLTAWKEERRLHRVQLEHKGIPPDPGQMTNASLSDSIGIQNLIYREPDDNDWREAWHVTEAMIGQMNDEVTQHGAKFMVATVTADIQVYPDPAVRKALMDRLGVTDLFYPDRRLQSMAERDGIAFVDLAVPMQIYADQNKVFLHGFGKEIGNGHWNDNGHKLAGDLISDKLCEITASGQSEGDNSL